MEIILFGSAVRAVSILQFAMAQQELRKSLSSFRKAVLEPVRGLITQTAELDSC